MCRSFGFCYSIFHFSECVAFHPPTPYLQCNSMNVVACSMECNENCLKKLVSLIVSICLACVILSCFSIHFLSRFGFTSSISPHPHLSLSISLPLSLSLSLSPSLSLFLSLSIYISLSLSFPLFLSLYFFLFLSLTFCFSLSIYLSYHSVNCLSIFICLPNYRSIHLGIVGLTTIYLFIYLSMCIRIFLPTFSASTCLFVLLVS